MARIPQVHVGRGPIGSNLAGVKLLGRRKDNTPSDDGGSEDAQKAPQAGAKEAGYGPEGQADPETQRGGSQARPGRACPDDGRARLAVAARNSAVRSSAARNARQRTSPGARTCPIAARR